MRGVNIVVGCILWLSIASVPAASPAEKPRLFLIGDSTVKNGRGDGSNGQWGWGQVVEQHFDTSRIEVVNRALGGRSSRTYLTEGLWQKVLDELKPGDFVLIQFGHNDGGEMFAGDRPRASIKGNGDETRDGVVEATGQAENVHSFGWYLRRYAQETQQRGATPIVLSLVPRDIWREGKVIRSDRDYGLWAKQAAEQAGAAFVDLNALVAARYEADGQTKVHAEYFTSADHTHTSKAGAEVNAACVIAGLRWLEECPLVDYLLPTEDKQAWNRKFDFGSGPVAPGHLGVRATSLFAEASEFGFLPGPVLIERPVSDGAVLGDGCSSGEPFYFVARVPEGNIRVRVHRAIGTSKPPMTIRAELRRLMVEQSTANEWSFVVNTRTPSIAGGQSVRLKPRERESEQWAWDDCLTLEFNGEQPAIAAIELAQVHDVATIFLAGDSTVADQAREPWASWGQMLPRFFDDRIAIANHAESGETLAGSLAAGRFDKIFSQIKIGDYLLVQFGHNDMKSKAPDALDRYRADLTALAERTEKAGAQLVFVTSMERKAGIAASTLGDYPQAVRDVARETSTPLIDLHAQSRQLYAALGDDLNKAFVDGTHHTAYGAYQLARLVAAGLGDQCPDLRSHLMLELRDVDLQAPDDPRTWQLPASPLRDETVPCGN